ncbi:MAG TPA: MraY family glycosyltransferase [Tepidisphaeraceae bacterium]|nr:MraY family glycosyltransferase [Tepidisphaeraceae bacterium]
MHLLAENLIPTFTVDEILSPYVYVFYISFLVSFFFTPVMRSVAVYYKIIDEPDSLRKIHRSPVAYLGGVSVFLGWLAGLALSQLIFLHRNGPRLPEHLIVPLGVIIGACIIVALGLWDDVRRIRPSVKIAGQVLAAVALLSQGIGTHAAGPLIEPINLRLQAWGLSIDLLQEPIVLTVSSLMTVGVVVFCCNATNLMDGLDGLCGGVTAIIAGGFVFVSVYLATYGTGTTTNADALRVVLGLALLGAILGFVPYNFNPASIFMGDAGSMFLGFASALMIILLAEVRSKWFLASMVMFALPVLDTTLAFARRWVNGRPLFSADKFHFHHQLVARGMTVRRAVLTSYGLAIAFVMLGAAIVYMRTRYVVAAYLVIFGSIIVAAYKMGMVHERPLVVKPQQLGSRKGEHIAAPINELETSSVLEISEDALPSSRPNSRPAPGTWDEPSPQTLDEVRPAAVRQEPSRV